MEEKILALLVAKFMGVNNAILSRIANKLTAKTTQTATDEEVATLIEGVTFQNVLDSYGDNRATEATQSAVSNYEKKYGIKEGQKVNGDDPDPNEPDPTGKDSETSAAIKTLLGVVKNLTDEVTAIKTGKITDSRKQRYEAVIANLSDDDKKPYQRTSIDSLTDEAFEALVTDVTAEVGVIEAREKARGSVFNRPLGGGGGGDKTPSKEEEEAVAKAMGMSNK